jgi:hypothetical protein
MTSVLTTSRLEGKRSTEETTDASRARNPGEGTIAPSSAVLQVDVIATGGSDGNQKPSSFFVLPKTKTRLE